VLVLTHIRLTRQLKSPRTIEMVKIAGLGKILMIAIIIRRLFILTCENDAFISTTRVRFSDRMITVFDDV
jgi:hypothetical protein